ncbi:protein kinase [Streptomyces sp. NPDC059720]|uniref:protein kinase domain-containing protein n=1 Tax=Streptomyces sp. NPDC059720 TaxID=3346924 RepID=UPI0036B0306F
MSTGEYGHDEGAGRLLAGRYRVTGRLGRGGMGVVWKAVDEVLGREVAVKELRTYTDVAGPELAALRLRMQREARAAARVRHPGVVAVHDIAEADGRPLIIMELVDGPSLDDVLRERGTLDPHEAAGIGAEVVDALAAAHRVGVLHRDVKPGNILLDRSGRVVLTDFGIATMDDPGDGSATHLTRSGELVGSLDYLAPERAQGADPGPASDIWALGATLYAAVEGASPFRRTSTFSTLTAIVTEPLPEPRRAGPLAPVLRRLMDKHPESRPEAEQASALLGSVADAGSADRPTSTLRRGPAAPSPRAATERSLPSVPPGFGPPQPLRPQAPEPDQPVPAGGATPGSAPERPGAATDAGPEGSGRQETAGPGSGPGAHDVTAVSPAAAGPAGTVRQPPTGPLPTPSAPRRRSSRALLAAAAVTVVLAAAGTTAALLAGSDGAGADARTDAAAASRSARTDDGARRPATRPDDGTTKPATGKEASPRGSATPPAAKSPEGGSGGTDGRTPDGGDPGTATAGTGNRGATDGSTATQTPACHAIGGGKYNCHVWKTAASYTASGTKAGILNAGTNYFYCQQNLGRRETDGRWTNVWWARTDDDSGNRDVWVSDVYVKGGDNDAPVPGLPYC